MTKKMYYEVEKTTYDATRPYAVVATFRSFNRVVARYEDYSAARRRAWGLNRKVGADLEPTPLRSGGLRAIGDGPAY